jgi:hypothetical protein
MAAERILVDGVGWAATSVFVASYLFADAKAIKRAQMAGALMWLLYGVLTRSTPVVVANVLVFTAAAWSAARTEPADTDPAALKGRAAGRPEGLRYERPQP